jgi:hypothetical protein
MYLDFSVGNAFWDLKWLTTLFLKTQRGEYVRVPNPKVVGKKARLPTSLETTFRMS